MTAIANLASEILLTGPPGLPTGLLELDCLTGGLAPGRLWVLLATPGAGRTVLAGQIALHVGVVLRERATLLLGREEPQRVVLNLVSALSGVPARRLASGKLSDDDTGRLSHAQALLPGAPLSVWSPADHTWTYEGGACRADFNVLRAGARPDRVLVVDDVDSLLDSPLLPELAQLREWTRRERFTLLVTLPEEGLVANGRVHQTLRREADVVLRLSRPDQFDPHHPRSGEADLEVISHRDGPTSRFLLSFVGFRRRFDGLRPAR